MAGKINLQNAALPLAHHHRVDGFQGWLQGRPVIEEIEKIAMQVERIDRVEFGYIGEVDPHRAIAIDLDRPVHVGERDRIGGVEFVLVIEVGVEPVHDDYEFLPSPVFVGRVQTIERGVPFLRMPFRIGIDDAETALVQEGLFGVVRNPIFSGLLVLLAGMFLAVPCAWTLALWIAAALTVAKQVRLEEQHLLDQHGEAYRGYASRVGRFVPGFGRLAHDEPLGDRAR